MNATVTQCIAAVCVVVIIAGLVWLATYYARKDGISEAHNVDETKLANANAEVAANVSVSNTADSLQNGQF
jgi:hypothetical protein